MQRILKEQIADQFKVAFGFCKEHWKYKFLLYPLYCSNLSHLIGSLLCRGRCTMREDLVFNFQQTGFFILCGSYIQLKGPKRFLSIPGPIVCLFAQMNEQTNTQTQKCAKKCASIVCKVGGSKQGVVVNVFRNWTRPSLWSRRLCTL